MVAMKTTAPASGTFERPYAGDSAPLILLIDDYDDASDMYALYLRRTGFRVMTADNVEHAVQIANDCHPAAIVLDFLSPADALGATRSMQAEASTWNIPVLVLTALPPAEVRGAVRGAGASVVVGKPCLPQHLVAEVLRMMRFARVGSPVVESKRTRSA
jgi:two-component system cell cycle response regulator DivK